MPRSRATAEGLARTLVGALRESGLRLTPQRTAVCEALARREDHPTAQTLYQELKPVVSSLSLTTVYQTLDSLVRTGTITSLGSAGDDSIHFEVNTEPHINLACLTCHRIRDLESAAVRDLEREVQAAVGSKVLSGRVVYYSECLETSIPRDCPYYPAREDAREVIHDR